MDESTVMMIAALALLPMEAAAYFFFKLQRERFAKLKNPQFALRSKATILKKTSYRGKHGTSYCAKLEFADWQGAQHKAEMNVPHARWETLQEGEGVEIVYLKDKPSVCALPEELDAQYKHMDRLMKLVLLGAVAMVPMILGLLVFLEPSA